MERQRECCRWDYSFKNNHDLTCIDTFLCFSLLAVVYLCSYAFSEESWSETYLKRSWLFSKETSLAPRRLLLYLTAHNTMCCYLKHTDLFLCVWEDSLNSIDYVCTEGWISAVWSDITMTLVPLCAFSQEEIVVYVS